MTEDQNMRLFLAQWTVRLQTVVTKQLLLQLFNSGNWVYWRLKITTLAQCPLGIYIYVCKREFDRELWQLLFVDSFTRKTLPAQNINFQYLKRKFSGLLNIRVPIKKLFIKELHLFQSREPQKKLSHQAPPHITYKQIFIYSKVFKKI